MNAVNQIMEIMDNIDYGFKDIHGINLIHNKEVWDNDFNNFYYLQSPEELLESKCGVCWDQVELERYLFNKKNILCKSYFIFMKEEDMLPSHTFITYKNNNKYYWFEHSWNKYKGIHEYNNEQLLLQDIINKFKEEHGNYKTYIYEYNTPLYHIKCNDFYKYIETQKYIDINSNC